MPSKASLNVSLTPELTSYVGALVAAGRYRSASEVLRAGLRLLQREEPPLPALDDAPRHKRTRANAATPNRSTLKS